MTAMTIDTIKQTDLTVSERQVLDDDRERWRRMGSGAHLDDWLAYGPGLLIRRRLAMRIAYVNRPEGKGYARAFAQLMEHDGLDTMDKTSISAVLWLHDAPERLSVLREIRETMTVGQRARLNSPISARQRVERELKVRAGGNEATSPTSPVTVLKRRLVEQRHQIAHLEEQLAAAGNGSLFDLKHDTADDIGRVIADSVSETKARGIAKAITDKLRVKQQRPAG
jgi:hypothetical protein